MNTMEDYLIRALHDDVGVLQLINVIRIGLGKCMLHNGVDGEEHHGAKKKKARIEAELELSAEIEESEEVVIDDIIASHLKKD